MDGSPASIARSNASRVQCDGPGLMKISVEAHQTMTRRLQPCLALKSRMSLRSASARSRLVFPVLTFFPSRRLTYCWSKTAGIGLTDFRKSPIGSMCSWRSSTPACSAAAYASSGTGSQAPNTRSFSAASGTKSRISGARPSVRLPSRIVPIWVSEPIGLAPPRRTFSTPAMNVVATAPSPTQSTPSFPSAGAIRRAACSGTANVLSREDPASRCARSAATGALPPRWRRGARRRNAGSP